MPDERILGVVLVAGRRMVEGSPMTGEPSIIVAGRGVVNGMSGISAIGREKRLGVWRESGGKGATGWRVCWSMCGW